MSSGPARPAAPATGAGGAAGTPLLGEGVALGGGISFGAYVVVHAGSAIGEGCTIGDHAVLGKPPRLAAHSSARGEVGSLRLGAGVSVGAGAVVFAGARIGDGAILGDQCFVREPRREGSVIGRGSVLDNDVAVGARVRVQSNVYLTAFSSVEDDVFVGPGVTTTNDDTMGRHGPGAQLRGARLRRACRVGGGAVLTPGVEVGEEAFVAAGASSRATHCRAVVIRRQPDLSRGRGRGPARALAADLRSLHGKAPLATTAPAVRRSTLAHRAAARDG